MTTRDDTRQPNLIPPDPAVEADGAPTHALTLHQPWATLIALGHKTCETRSWAAAQRFQGTVIAIHAGRTESKDLRDDPGISPLLGSGPTPKGAVVAIARLDQCVPAGSCRPGPLERRVGDFSPGRFAWVLTDVRPLTEPVPCRGYQKLWTLPAGLVTIIMGRAGPAPGPNSRQGRA